MYVHIYFSVYLGIKYSLRKMLLKTCFNFTIGPFQNTNNPSQAKGGIPEMKSPHPQMSIKKRKKKTCYNTH